MAECDQAAQSERARPSPPQWSAFLEMGFRPLYIGGSFWAAAALALWVFWPASLRGLLTGVSWHGHEMLWGFVATVAVGFLLTAVSTWTGTEPLAGRWLAALCWCWLCARVGFLVPGTNAFLLAAVCELAFFTGAAVAIGRPVYATRSQRNYGVPLMVLGLGLGDAWFLWAVANDDYAYGRELFGAALLGMTFLALLVARRVIPFFAMRAVPALKVPMHTRSGHWQLAAGGLAIGCSLWDAPRASAVFLAVAGGIAIVQLAAWRPWAVRHVPMLWILYAGYAALGTGLLVASWQLADWPSTEAVRAAWPVHLIGVAGFSVLIVGMITRTALGHLGRPLRANRAMVGCYGLMITAAALRLLALLPIALSPVALQVSAGAWIGAFGIYLHCFFPLMIRPRLTAATPTQQNE